MGYTNKKVRLLGLFLSFIAALLIWLLIFRLNVQAADLAAQPPVISLAISKILPAENCKSIVEKPEIFTITYPISYSIANLTPIARLWPGLF